MWGAASRGSRAIARSAEEMEDFIRVWEGGDWDRARARVWAPAMKWRRDWTVVEFCWRWRR